MNVKPVSVLLALVALGLLALGYDWSLRHFTRHGLSLELAAEPPLAIHPGETIEGKLHSVPKDTSLTLDGEPEPLAVDGGDGLQLPPQSAGPGLHVARLDVGSRVSTSDGVRLWERSIALGMMEGPFDSPSRWHPCAVELHVRQSLLDDFLSPELIRRLSSLHELPMTPAIAKAVPGFKWAGDGVDAAIHVAFASGSDLEIRGHLSISVDAQHDLRLERLKDLEISGSQVTAWHGLFKVRLAVALDAILGGFSGEGFAKGAQRGLASIDAKIRDKITTVVDEKLLKLDELVRLPGAIAVEGINLKYRYCRQVEIVAGRSATIGFDVEVTESKREPAATFGFAAMPASPVPALSEMHGNVAVDFSPVLLNALLDAAWRSGRLSQLMNEPRWLNRINENHSDTQLDFKISSVEPLLPPVLEAAENGARIRMVETKMNLVGKDTGRERDTRLFADIHVHPRFDAARDELGLDCALSDLAATCHDPQAATDKVLLTPCYADLLRAIDERHLETAENSPIQLGPSLRHLLQALPFKLSDIQPALLASNGQPWFRVSAEMASTPSH